MDNDRVPFLQSKPWAEFQKSHGRTVVSDNGAGWSYQAVVESGTLNRRLYTPYGPVVSTVDDFDSALTSLKAQAKSHNATFIRVEPTAGISQKQLRQRGFLPVTYNQLQPAHTQIIDLTPPRGDILAGMSQNSRNITRNYHKKGLVIQTSHNPAAITILTNLLAEMAQRTGIRTHSAAYLSAQADSLLPSGAATLYYAANTDEPDTPLAAALVYDSPTTRTYAHAAASDTRRNLNAGTALLGQLILDAKDKGLSQVDLYGIAPTTDKSHPWAGFTKFKKSFGGTEKSYVGAWDLPMKPLAYRLYRAYQFIARAAR